MSGTLTKTVRSFTCLVSVRPVSSYVRSGRINLVCLKGQVYTLTDRSAWVCGRVDHSETDRNALGDGRRQTGTVGRTKRAVTGLREKPTLKGPQQ